MRGIIGIHGRGLLPYNGLRLLRWDFLVEALTIWEHIFHWEGLSCFCSWCS